MSHSFPGISSESRSVRRFAPLPDNVIVGLSNRYQKNRAAVLTDELKRLDPAGWEGWLDSDAVPETGWLEIADAIQARVLELESQPIEECSCSSADAAGVSGCGCFVCRGENLTEAIPFN